MCHSVRSESADNNHPYGAASFLYKVSLASIPIPKTYELMQHVILQEVSCIRAPLIDITFEIGIFGFFRVAK